MENKKMHPKRKFYSKDHFQILSNVLIQKMNTKNGLRIFLKETRNKHNVQRQEGIQRLVEIALNHGIPRSVAEKTILQFHIHLYRMFSEKNRHCCDRRRERRRLRRETRQRRYRNINRPVMVAEIPNSPVQTKRKIKSNKIMPVIRI